MDHQQMYSLLFNAITDALRELDAQNFGLAKEILIQAQLQTEELYIEQ